MSSTNQGDASDMFLLFVHRQAGFPGIEQRTTPAAFVAGSHGCNGRAQRAGARAEFSQLKPTKLT
jgi:hypothetical protein